MAKLTIEQMKANLADITVWRRVLTAWFSVAALLGVAFIGIPMIGIYFVGQLWRARHLLFSFGGRVGRRAFWLVVVSFVVADLLAAGILVGAAQELLSDTKSQSSAGKLWLAATVILFVVAPTVVGLVGLGVRRLNDLDRSHGWLLALYGIPALGAAMVSVPMMPPAAQGLILLLIVVPSLLCTFIVLGSWRGTVGPNKFGADPNLRPATPVRTDASPDQPRRATRPA